MQHESNVRSPERAGGLHELTLLHGHHLATYETRIVDPACECKRDDEVDKARSEERHDGDRKKNPRQRKKSMRKVEVDERVGPTLIEGGDASENSAHDE